MTSEDLDTIWNAQVEKHEAIVKNIHELLAKLAWDFSPEQLDHLFECFQVRISPSRMCLRWKNLRLLHNHGVAERCACPRGFRQQRPR